MTETTTTAKKKEEKTRKTQRKKCEHFFIPKGYQKSGFLKIEKYFSANFMIFFMKNCEFIERKKNHLKLYTQQEAPMNRRIQ